MSATNIALGDGRPRLAARSRNRRKACRNRDHASDHRRERHGQRSARALDSRARPPSRRSFLKIDCASLPSELVESELFGHERGAFTGAVARKPGRLEMAQGGTIVLDEVAALSPGMQAKLLRVLEERTFERLGGTETLRMDARLMALTNTDLTTRRRRRALPRRSFFPPERARDCRAAAARAPCGYRAARRAFSRAARPGARPRRCRARPGRLGLLESYAWPGNVRELKNAIEHALVFAKASRNCAPKIFRKLCSAREARRLAAAACDRSRISSAKPSGPRSKHALQNRPRRGNSRHQPQNAARKAQEIRFDRDRRGRSLVASGCNCDLR